MHPRHAPGPGYPSGCRWPACGITCAAPAVRRVACHRACERRTPHSDTARSWRRKSVGYARHGLPRGQAEAGIRSGPALATGRAIGGRSAWYRWVGGLHPLNIYAAQGLSKVQPSTVAYARLPQPNEPLNIALQPRDVYDSEIALTGPLGDDEHFKIELAVVVAK